jgi:hypothetical protein
MDQIFIMDPGLLFFPESIPSLLFGTGKMISIP